MLLSMRCPTSLSLLLVVVMTCPLMTGTDSVRAKRTRLSKKNMVKVPKGDYRVVVPGSDAADSTKVVALDTFRIDRHEVSVAEYRRCVQSAKCSEPQVGTYFSLAQRREDFKQFCNWTHADRADHPINCIDRQQAQEYCAFMGKTLPTSAQWEAANYGGDTKRQRRPFAFGEKLEETTRLCHKRKAQRLGTCTTRRVDEDQTPAKVRDLASNVSEWTATDACPGGGSDCRNTLAVIRGGNWYNDYAVGQGTRRQRLVTPKTYDHILGFRCVSK